MTAFAAADLGATSGRVMVGRVGPGLLDLTEVHRFPNVPVRLPGGLHWDILGLHRGVLDGLRAAARLGPVSIGVDGWGVDYALLDADGELTGNPYHYRDSRTEHPVMPLDPVELYAITGIQHLPINTVHQLAAARGTAALAAARTVLPVPDLLVHWLTGTLGAEATNASTTALFDATTRDWSPRVAAAIGLDPALLPPIRQPGQTAGPLLPYAVAATGLPAGTPVVTVASHDTASAVVAIPAAEPGFGFISCGTWSLAGLELDAPVLTEAARAANFTNELGLDGSVRFLRNTMGLWLLSETLRDWNADLGELLGQAAKATPLTAVVDADDPEFLAPDDMPTRIAAACARTGQPVAPDRGTLVRVILDSLALAHARTLRAAAALSDRELTVVHLVGGGARNDLLCQLTADATGLPVLAGPAEATALGNVLVQARAHGLVGDRAELRALVAATQTVRRFTPRGDTARWAAVAARLG